MGLRMLCFRFQGGHMADLSMGEVRQHTSPQTGHRAAATRARKSSCIVPAAFPHCPEHHSLKARAAGPELLFATRWVGAVRRSRRNSPYSGSVLMCPSSFMWCSLSFDGSLCVLRSAGEWPYPPVRPMQPVLPQTARDRKTRLGTEGAVAEGAGG